MQMILVNEFQIDSATQQQISNLLVLCFPEEDFYGRTYFKQHPHYRLLLKDQDELIGQVGLDYRVMLQNHQPIDVLGLIDVAVAPMHQGQGHASRLIFKLIDIAQDFENNIDVILLASDHHAFYRRFGFELTRQHATWLATENHLNYGMKQAYVDDCLMFKQIGQKHWVADSSLDFLGYWY